MEAAKDAAGTMRVPGFGREQLTLLVLDEPHTEWAKYFRGRRVHNEFDVRVEQADVADVAVINNEEGITVTIGKQGANTRSFRPDCVLVRQPVRDGCNDYSDVLVALHYGNVASINELNTLRQFQDKPWTFGSLLETQRRLGKDRFPLIEQSFFPANKEVLSANLPTKFPCVLKLGHAHNGNAKVKVENSAQLQELIGVASISNTYFTIEPFVDAKYDLHVQKIGSHYKAHMRKSLSGNWKTNVGQSILEEVEVTDRYREWIDAVCDSFGQMQLCSLEAVVAKDGAEHIIEVNDSGALTLMGDGQEEDRRHIADLVIQLMENNCNKDKDANTKETTNKDANKEVRHKDVRKESNAKETSKEMNKKETSKEMNKEASSKEASDRKETSMSRTLSRGASKESGPPRPPPPTPPAAARPVPPPKPPAAVRPTSATSAEGAAAKPQDSSDSSESDSSAEEEDASSDTSEASSAKATATAAATTTTTTTSGEGEKGAETMEGEDTMKNLRRTFAGIFGDIK